MTQHVIISPCTTVTFAPTTNESPFLGGDWLSNRLPYNINNRSTKHKQKIELGDLVSVQIHTRPGLSTPPVLKIISCNGVEYTVPYRSIALVYTTYDSNGEPTTYATWHFEFKFSAYVLDSGEGTYHLELSTTFGSEGSVEFISEPLDVKVTHGNTMYLRFNCDTNRLETLFENFNVAFGRRFPLRIKDFEPQREETDFTLENQKLIKIVSYPYNIYSFQLDKLADYEIDALNYILACDKLQIDNRVYVSNEQIEKERSGTDPLYRATIQVRDAELLQNFAYSATSTVVLFNIPAYPFGILYAYIHNGYSGVSFPDNTEVEDESALEDLIAEMNDTASLYGATGEFAIQGGQVVYINGVGENYIVPDSKVTNNRFEIEVEAQTANSVFQIGSSYFWGFINWGDGTPNPLIYQLSTSGLVYTQHTYADVDTYTAKFWYLESDGVELNLNQSVDPRLGTGALIKSFEQYTGAIQNGAATTKLARFLIAVAELESGIDLTWLRGAAGTLENVTVYYNNLASIDSTWLNNTPWAKLKTFQFQQNQLNVSSVNGLISGVKRNIPTSFRGFIDIRQTPPAAPTLIGLADRNALRNAGWTVYTN